VAGGLIYQATDRWTLRLGGLYENTPVPNLTRTPRLPEEDNLGLAVGGTFRVNERWDVDFGWSHLIPHDADIRLSDPAAGTLRGRVRWKTDAVAIGITRQF
jgi:long-chain fatty acid transport protein